MIDMGINLRRPDIHVTQHLLDTSEIRPSTEQVSGETVTQCMNRQIPGHARPCGIPLDQPPDLDACQGPAGP